MTTAIQTKPPKIMGNYSIQIISTIINRIRSIFSSKPNIQETEIDAPFHINEYTNNAIIEKYNRKIKEKMIKSTSFYFKNF